MTARALDLPADELTVLSPEGTTIRFRLASLSDRAVAVAIDLAIVQVATFLVAVLAMIFTGFTNRPLGVAVFLFASFFFRSLYFAAAELYWSGQSFGKLKIGLRAISRDGGPLRGQAILARNLTREIELFLPLVALSQPRLLIDIDERLALPIACAWLAVFALLPIVNRERLRFGDLLGGTVVVRIPRPMLLSDLAGGERSAQDAYKFTLAQLEVYGIAELQVLETVLRRARSTTDGRLAQEISSRIRRKIGWSTAGHLDHEAFIGAFYEAQRSHLERKLIMGVRKESKSS